MRPHGVARGADRGGVKSPQRLTVFALVSMGILLVGLAGLWAAASPGAAIPRLGGGFNFGASDEPVLVFVVGSTEGVARVRAAVDASRVVAESTGAFALRDKRLVAATAESVGPLLVRAGWRDAELEILAVRESLRPRQGDASPQRAGDEAQLTELIHKPTLTLSEARRLLASMH